MLRNLFQQKIAHESDVYWEEWKNRSWLDAVLGAVLTGVIIYLFIVLLRVVNP